MGDVLAVRDEYRTQDWVVLIQECNASGLTNKEFCRQRGVSEKSYYYWLPYLGKSPSHEEMESLMPWAPDIQQDHKMPNSDAYEKCYLE